MKSGAQYIILFGVLLLLSSGLVVGLMMLKPEIFQGFGHGDESSTSQVESAAPESMQLRSVAGPTLAELRGPDTTVVAGPDSLALLKDSLRVLASQLVQERQKSEALSHPKPEAQAPPPPAVDTAKAKERKGMAKVLESMPAENAAKILQDLPEDEMKELLMYVKKRQAAKILSAIDPTRASKLFR
jgi:hypothetical protein